jgi:hypothetical protein
VARAGEYAARICEERQHWDEAISIYERVQQAVPALRLVLDKKIASAHAAQARWEASSK